MNRRELLGRATALGATIAIAGCVGRERRTGGAGGDGEDATDGSGGTTDGSGGTTDDSGDGSPDGDSTTGSPDDTDDQSVAPSVVDRRIETAGANCGEGNDASVEFGDDAVTITGKIQASDPCHVAELVGASYDADADELSVSVGAVEDEDAGVCAQCIAVVDYTATVAFDGGLPGRVTVTHSGMTDSVEVASETR